MVPKLLSKVDSSVNFRVFLAEQRCKFGARAELPEGIAKEREAEVG